MKYELVVALVPIDEISQVKFSEHSHHAHIEIPEDASSEAVQDIGKSFAELLHEKIWPERNPTKMLITAFHGSDFWEREVAEARKAV